MTPERGPGERVVHVTTVPMSLTFLRTLVPVLRRAGMTVEAVSSPGADAGVFSRLLDVPVHTVEMPRRISPVRDLIALARLTALVRRLRPDIVHAHTPKGGLLGMIAAWLARVPVRIYHMRGLPLDSATGPRRRLLVHCERLSCRLAHHVICVGPSLRAQAIALALVSPNKSGTLVNGSGQGVDATGRFDPRRLTPGAGDAVRERFGIPADAPVVGFVGRLVRDKGIVELWAAWTTLRERFPDLHLLLVGSWEPHDPIPRAVRSTLEDDPRVHVAGWDWNTPPLYAAMDLVTLPTYREGFPNVPLEAAAMELPVVATRIPGCVDAVADGTTGALVPARDSAALAAAIGGYVADPDLRRRHGQAGRERVLREFRPERIAEDMLALYRKVMQEATLDASLSGWLGASDSTRFDSAKLQSSVRTPDPESVSRAPAPR
jgi:glycosyltransferase involved in cell wall biosynthesis